MFIRILTATAVLALLACNGEERRGARGPQDTIPPPPYSEETLPIDSPPSAGVPGPPDSAPRPQRKRAAVIVEGMADTLELRLVRAPARFPLRFSTYLPPDMAVTTEAAQGGRAIRFVANFGGVHNERAYVQFYFYPRGTTRLMARNQINGFLTGLNPQVDRTAPEVPFPWALEQTRFSYPHEGQTFVGTVALAERGNVLFHYVQHYPAEYADGMAGRIRTLMEEWRWEDGTALLP
jgi:hypothetical protein